MVRAAVHAVAVAMVAACYSPAAPLGAPCGDDGDCPSGQRCTASACRLPGDPGIPDAALDDAAPIDGGVRFGWGTATRVPGVNISGFSDSDPSMTEDRLTIAFTSSRPGGEGNEDLYLGTRATVDAAFVVVALTNLNSVDYDASPELSSNGSALYFTSDRSGTLEVYRSLRGTGGVYGAPTLVGPLSGPGADSDLGISPDGLTAILARNSDFYESNRATTAEAWSAPRRIAELDLDANPAAPTLTNGAGELYFHAGTSRDIFVSFRAGTSFTAPIAVSELNTGAREASPFIMPGGRRLLFERAGDIFEVTR